MFLLYVQFGKVNENEREMEFFLQVLSYIFGMLCNVLDQFDLCGRLEGSIWLVLEIVVGVSNMVVSRQNLEVMLD